MYLLLICYLSGLSDKIRTSMWLTLIGIGVYVFTIGGLNFGQVYAAETEESLENNEQEAVEEEGENNEHDAAGKETKSDGQTSYVEESLEILIAGSELNVQPATTLISPEANNNKEFYTVLLWYMEQKDDAKDFYYLEETIKLLGNLSDKEASKYGLDRGALVVALADVYENAPNKAKSGQELYIVTELENGLVLLETNKTSSLLRVSFHVNNRFFAACERAQCDRFVVDAENGDTISLYYTTDKGIEDKADINI